MVDEVVPAYCCAFQPGGATTDATVYPGSGFPAGSPRHAQFEGMGWGEATDEVVEEGLVGESSGFAFNPLDGERHWCHA